MAKNNNLKSIKTLGFGYIYPHKPSWMIKGFIFDLDGVITDTAELHYQAWKSLADELGWNFDREVNEKLRGVSRMDSINIIMNHNGATIEENELMELAKKKNDIYVSSLDQLTPDDYLPGAQELLKELKREGFKIALGSASKNSDKVLQQLDAKKYFDVIGDGNSVSKSKPEPDIFLYGAKKLNLRPEECIVFEDAESGVDAAKAGGFYSIGIGPVDRVGHADFRLNTMLEANLETIRNRFSRLFN